MRSDQVDFQILGPLQVIDGGRSVTLPRGRARALLALLILHAGEVVSTDRLIDELWGESPPPTVTTALQGLVSNLRKRLEPGRVAGQGSTLLRTASPGYVLDVDPAAVDAHRFRRLLSEVEEGTPSERSEILHRALGLWRGPALADFRYEPFAQREITALEELRLAAVEARVDADLALGLDRELVAELEALVADHPFHEDLRGRLMLALYRAGRQTEALDVYREGRRALIEELGIEPGPTLRHLEQAILRHEPSLDVTPEVAAQTQVAPRTWLSGERRLVTVVFADLATAAELGSGLDPEALRRTAARRRDLAADVLGRHGGTVEGLVGDVVVALFGSPVAHEDDALRAVRATVELRATLMAPTEETERDLGVRPCVRAGVETGEVVVDGSATRGEAASGGAVNVAARLQRLAGDGEVILGEVTRHLLRDAVRLEPVPSGPDEPGRPDAAWRLVDLPGDTDVAVRGPDAPIVGRATELSALRAAFDRVVGQRAAYRLTVLGDAGIGKSKLALEFVEALGSSALVLTGRCQAYGDGITFWPLREVVLQAVGERGWHGLTDLLAGEDDRDWIAAQVGGATGLAPGPVEADELFRAFRRLFEMLCDRRPLVLVLEDLHWAEATLLDLISYVADEACGPLLLLCVARPELREKRPLWGAGGQTADTLFLEPLDDDDTEQLIALRLTKRALPAETRARLLETAQGNPLFVEQMIADFENEGSVTVPDTVRALLSARLDRLGPGERDLLRCAAVIGTDFRTDALETLVPSQARRFIERHLASLEHRRLIRPARSPGANFSFAHVLIQLTAYRSLTKEARGGLHERLADWLEDRAAPSPSAFEELIGYHLERACLDRRDVDPLDETAAALAVRAGGYLAVAGLRAAARYDIAAAANLLSRANGLLPSTHPQHRTVVRRLAEAYQVLGRTRDADAVLTAMLREVESDGDVLVGQVVRLERARLALATGPDPITLASIQEEGERALEVFTASEDDAGLALAYYVLGFAHFRAGATREMEHIARRCLEHADRTDHPREAMAARIIVAWSIATGMTTVPEGIRLLEELVPTTLGLDHAIVLGELAGLRAMCGEFDVARELVDRGRSLALEQMGGPAPLLLLARSSASVELAADDLEAAEHHLRVALEFGLDAGLREAVAQAAALLSRVLNVEGEVAQAELFASMSEEHAPGESVAAQGLWRAAKARVSSSRGDHRAAERLAGEAVALALGEMPNLRADLLLDLAEVHRASGDPDAVVPLADQAIELYERKGNLVAAARARSLVR